MVANQSGESELSSPALLWALKLNRALSAFLLLCAMQTITSAGALFSGKAAYIQTERNIRQHIAPAFLSAQTREKRERSIHEMMK